MKENLMIILGPTGIGKTSLSIEIAKKYNGEIIGADSMQIYKGFDIGTGKVTEEEMEGIPHHLIDFLDPRAEFSVEEFRTLAKEKISEINRRDKLPIMVGGTGLYINSIVYDFSMQKIEKDDEYRKYLDSYIDEHGLESLYAKMVELDPKLEDNIHPNNRHRIIRAMEILNSGEKKETEDFRRENTDYNLYMLGLNTDREVLYDRINRRVDMMMEEGFLNEVKSLYEKGIDEHFQSMKAIGYREMLMYLEGKVDLEFAVDKMKQFSRNYAKRQLTWFRRDERIRWFDPLNEDRKEIFEEIERKFF